MMLREAHEFDTSKQMGEFVEESLEPIPFGRIGAQAAKQVILQKVRDAEREQVRWRNSCPVMTNSSTGRYGELIVAM